MDARTLAKICIRLLALYTAWRSITYLPFLTTTIWSGEFETPVAKPLYVVVTVLFPFVVSIALWLLSDKLAEQLVASPIVHKQHSTVSGKELQAIAISTAGLVMLLWTLPSLFSYAAHNLSLDEHNGNLMVGFIDAMIPLIQCLFALTMVFGAGIWTESIRRFKSFGLQNK